MSLRTDLHLQIKLVYNILLVQSMDFERIVFYLSPPIPAQRLKKIIGDLEKNKFIVKNSGGLYSVTPKFINKIYELMEIETKLRDFCRDILFSDEIKN